MALITVTNTVTKKKMNSFCFCSKEAHLLHGRQVVTLKMSQVAVTSTWTWGRIEDNHTFAPVQLPLSLILPPVFSLDPKQEHP